MIRNQENEPKLKNGTHISSINRYKRLQQQKDALEVMVL
jgi:hypothetical protein